jgi:hypothetical protein
MAIKISHELPNNLLGLSKRVNDYDYCLPHILDIDKRYEKHFRNERECGNYIIMDNSLHELGKAYDTDRLLYWIKELEPDEFIVPDVWEDQTETISNAIDWMTVELPECTTAVAVVQAKSFDEAAVCYQSLKQIGYKKIAFSYGASYYNDLVPHPNKLIGKMLGRIMTISKLHQLGIIEKTDRVHLLGCALPQEFVYYNQKDFPFIETIDTSNPIIHALEGIEYKDHGLLTKSSTKIDQIEEKELTSELLYSINHNVNRFKRFVNE